ncbi:hypothetical protein IJT17_02920 [bacterium]|nr:hypothetical protein [bacterium]
MAQSWKNAKTGDIIELGSYPFAADGQPQAIKWAVLGRSDEGLLALSVYGLEARCYHGHEQDITWRDCDLRRWLNQDFLRQAFSEAERGELMLTEVFNDGNEEYDTDGGEDTEDRVFVLSLYEFEEFCAGGELAVCLPSPYARERGMKHADSESEEQGAGGWWWLRTPGSEGDFALEVGGYGEVGEEGTPVHWSGGLVRPAIQLRLQ